MGDKMNSPTNSGSSTSYFLRWSNANQGTWATLPTASATQAGTMSSVHYTQVNNTKRYVSNEGKTAYLILGIGQMGLLNYGQR